VAGLASLERIFPRERGARHKPRHEPTLKAAKKKGFETVIGVARRMVTK
jgi:hypothetical protein